MLEVKDIHTFYGASQALFGVSLNVKQGESVSLIGRNGAGKTTTIRSIMGLTQARQGNIKFNGVNIKGLPPFVIARKGIGFVSEDRCIFPNLSVRDNLEVSTWKGGRDKDLAIDRVYGLFPALKKLASRSGGYLSGGQQQMLAIARALMGDPSLLLLDEPMQGLSPVIIHGIEEKLQELKKGTISLLLVEQNFPSAMRLCERCYVLDKGTICFEGSIEELNRNDELKSKYLAV